MAEVEEGIESDQLEGNVDELVSSEPVGPEAAEQAVERAVDKEGVAVADGTSSGIEIKNVNKYL